MLILTRRAGESVVISEGIYCTILESRSDEVKLAFDAPPSISINRDEIQRRIWRAQQENQMIEKPWPHKESVVDRLIITALNEPRVK